VVLLRIEDVWDVTLCLFGYQHYGGTERFRCQGPSSLTTKRHFPEVRSPQPLTLRSAVAAVFATLNEIVKVSALHLAGLSSAEVAVNVIISVPLKLLMGNKYRTSKL
jgi:hypothetical protein